MSNLKTTIVKSLYYFKSNKLLFSSCAKSQRFFWLMNSLEVKVAFPRHVLYFQHIFGNITDSHFLIYFRSRAVAAPVIPTLNLAKLKRWKKFFFFSLFFQLLLQIWRSLYYYILHTVTKLHTKYLTIVFVLVDYSTFDNRHQQTAQKAEAKKFFLPFSPPPPTFLLKKHISYSYRGIPKMKWCVLGKTLQQTRSCIL